MAVYSFMLNIIQAYAATTQKHDNFHKFPINLNIELEQGIDYLQISDFFFFNFFQHHL